MSPPGSAGFLSSGASDQSSLGILSNLISSSSNHASPKLWSSSRKSVSYSSILWRRLSFANWSARILEASSRLMRSIRCVLEVSIRARLDSCSSVSASWDLVEALARGVAGAMGITSGVVGSCKGSLRIWWHGRCIWLWNMRDHSTIITPNVLQWNNRWLRSNQSPPGTKLQVVALDHVQPFHLFLSKGRIWQL